MMGIMYCIIILLICGLVVWHFVRPIIHGVLPPASNNEKEKPTVLITYMVDGLGGGEYYTLAIFELLLKTNPHIAIVVPHDAFLHQRLHERKLPFISCHLHKLYHHRWLFTQLFKITLYVIHRRYPFTIIHCINHFELPGARAFADKHHGKVVFTRHVPSPIKQKYLVYPHGIIGLSPFIADYFCEELAKICLMKTRVTSIIPPFDETRFASFLQKHPTIATREERNAFFEKKYGFSLNNEPALSVIARMPPDGEHKNHTLLFQIMASLIHEKKKPIHALLAGDGPRRPILEAQARALAIEQYTHFLGFTSYVPEILHYSDFMVLTSNTEALGIVYLEAGYLKKASVGATKTGAEAVIVHNKTGLLYENGNRQSALEAIEYCIDHPEKAREMGIQAHQHVIDNFSPEMLGNKTQELYQSIQ